MQQPGEDRGQWGQEPAPVFRVFCVWGGRKFIHFWTTWKQKASVDVQSEIMAYLVITQLGPMFEPALISKATAHCKRQTNSAENSPFSLTTAQKLLQMLLLKPHLHCPRPFSATLNQSASTYPRFHVGPGSICLISAGWFVLWWFSFAAAETNVNMKKVNALYLSGSSAAGNWLIPGNSGELLFQCLNVGKLDSLSSASGFDHITLKGNKCKGQSCPLREIFFFFNKSFVKTPEVKSYLD